VQPFGHVIASFLVLSVLATPAAAQELTETEVVSRLLERNPSFRASLADRVAARASARTASGGRVPVLTTTASGTHNESIVNSGTRILPNAADRIAFTSSLAYTTNWGLAVTFSLDGGFGSRTASNFGSPTPVNIGFSYDATAALSLRQPLLRGAGEDSVLGAYLEAESGASHAEASAEAELSQLLSDALSAHWELWYATRALEVQESALELSTRQVSDADLRAHELGTIAPTEVLRLSVELTSIRRALASAESALATQAITIGRLLGLSPEEASPLRALPQTPIMEAPPSLASLLDGATERSANLRALEADVETARIVMARARDAAEVRLDLTGEVGAGVLFNDTTLSAGTLPNDRPAVSAMIGLELEAPMGPSAASAERDRADAQLEGAEARLEAGRGELAAQVATLHTELLRALRDVTLAQEAADASHALAEAERARFELGLNEAYDIVQAQQSEREALLSHLRAVADFATARIELEHRTGALLTALGVSLPEVPR